MKKINYKIVIVFIVLLGLVIGNYFFSQKYSLQTVAPITTKDSIKNNSPHHDLGQISMREGVKQLTYTFRNNTDQSLQLSNLYTSCMCTKAKIIIDDAESPFAGMQGHTSGLMPIDPNMELNPGQKAKLLVEFDPNAHGPMGTGPMTRSVVLETSDTDQPLRQFTFAGVVVE